MPIFKGDTYTGALIDHDSAVPQPSRDLPGMADGGDRIVHTVEDEDRVVSLDVSEFVVADLLGGLEAPSGTVQTCSGEGISKGALGQVSLVERVQIIGRLGTERRVSASDAKEGERVRVPRLFLGLAGSQGLSPASVQRHGDCLDSGWYLIRPVEFAQDGGFDLGNGIVTIHSQALCRGLFAELLFQDLVEGVHQILASSVLTLVLCQRTELLASLDTLVESIQKRQLSIAGAADPGRGGVVGGEQVTVQHHAVDAIGEHGGEGLSEDGAVRGAPVVDKGALVQGVDDRDHVSSCKGSADEAAVLVVILIAGIGDLACLLPARGTDLLPGVGLWKVIEFFCSTSETAPLSHVRFQRI